MRFLNLTRDVEIGANSYLIEIANKRIVLDAGMHPKAIGDAALPQFELLGDDSIDAIFVSHSHHDHIGTLPVLLRRQPGARVFMTEATRQLSDIMLHNSVNVMLRQREEYSIPNYPLFGHREVETGARRWQACPIQTRCSFEGERLGPHANAEPSFEFYDAGHILGSVGVLIRTEGCTLFYTGDVNFEDQTLCRAARFPEEPLDVLIVETTRGDQETPAGLTRQTEEERLARELSAAFERGGCVLIPVFALGKTQELLALLHGLFRKGLLRNVPIYIGGLSTKLTEVYDRLAHCAPRLQPDLQIMETIAPFVIAGRSDGNPPINKPRIYALSSGMMTEKTLSNSFARRLVEQCDQSIFFIGYADPDSPAGAIRRASTGTPVVLDSQLPAQELRCSVREFSLSGHATRESIRAYVNRVRPKKVILVHGDQPAVNWFKQALSADLPESEILVPEPGIPLDL